MNDDIVISIIVPIYNTEKYLNECVDSIINQTYKNIEIILVNDGSTDNCLKICDEYAQKDKRVKVIHKENGGLSSARNSGLDILTGKYVCFIDSDDYVATTFVYDMFNLITKYNADIVQCKYTNQSFVKLNNEEILDSEQAILCLNNIDTHRTFVIACNKMYDVKLFDNVRFPIGKISEDAYTTYILFDKLEKMVVSESALYYYRTTPNSITNRKFSTKRYDAILAYEKEIEYFKNINKNLQYESALSLYQHMLKKYYILTYKFIENNKLKNLNFLKNKLKKNLPNFIKYSDDKNNIKIKVILFSLFPDFYCAMTKIIYLLKLKIGGKRYDT